MRLHRSFFCILAVLAALVACRSPFGSGDGSGPVVSDQLAYDGPVALSIKLHHLLEGTEIGYEGKTPDGRALMTFSGQQAPKSSADSINWTGAFAPGSLVTLSTRLTTYDDNSANLVGTVHIEIKDPQPQPGDASPDLITSFTLPVTYNVNKNANVPGTLIAYLGKTPNGAQFSNIGAIPFVQQFDSIVWQGHLRDKIALRLDLRVLTFNDDDARLGGTAKVTFER